MRSAASIIVTAAAAALALAPAADARWLAPTALGPTGTSTYPPALAAGPDGTAAAIFPAVADGRLHFRALVRPAGGAWTPTTLETPTSGTSAVDVVIGADGAATAVWVATSGPSYAIRTSTRPAGGVWSEPTDLSDNVRSADQPSLAAGPDGSVAAIWRHYDGSRWLVEARVRPAGGAWGTVDVLSAAGQDANTPRIALDGSGSAYAIWSRSNGSRGVIETRVKPAGGRWGPTGALSSASYGSGQPQIAVSPAGDAVATWTHNTSPTKVQARVRPAGGAWEATTHDLSAAGRRATEPQVGVDADGDVVAAWTESDGLNQLVRTAERPRGGGWSQSDPRSAAGASAGALTLAVAPDGAAVAGWTSWEDATYVTQAARRSPGGGWEPAETLSVTGRDAFYPQVALDGRGNAVAAWDRRTDADPAQHEIQAIGFDGEAPRLDAISVPAATTTDADVALSAVASDVWSPPVTVSWDFHDGASATGTTVAHRFVHVGARDVTVTATDAIGRQTTATRTIAVGPAPVVAPPPGGGGGAGRPAAAPLRATLSGSGQRLRQLSRQRALKVRCALGAAGRCTVTATLPAKVARALGLRLPRTARAYTLGSASARVAGPRTTATVAIALDRRERAALRRVRAGRGLTIALTARATAADGRAASATATVRLRR